MNLAAILSIILANPQSITGLINMFKATTAAAPVTVPAVPATGDKPAVAAVKKEPSEAIRALQKILNLVLKPATPLVEDGWLGPKTEAAILQALALAKPYLSMIG